MAACIVVASVALGQRPSDRGGYVDETEAKVINESAVVNGREAPKEAARYVIEPPDVLRIEALRLVPKEPYRIWERDVLRAYVNGALPPQDISNVSAFAERDEQATRALVNRTIFEARLAYRRGIDEGNHLLDVLGDQPVKQHLVTVL